MVCVVAIAEAHCGDAAGGEGVLPRGVEGGGGVRNGLTFRLRRGRCAIDIGQRVGLAIITSNKELHRSGSHLLRRNGEAAAASTFTSHHTPLRASPLAVVTNCTVFLVLRSSLLFTTLFIAKRAAEPHKARRQFAPADAARRFAVVPFEVLRGAAAAVAESLPVEVSRRKVVEAAAGAGVGVMEKVVSIFDCLAQQWVIEDLILNFNTTVGIAVDSRLREGCSLLLCLRFLLPLLLLLKSTRDDCALSAQELRSVREPRRAVLAAAVAILLHVCIAAHTCQCPPLRKEVWVGREEALPIVNSRAVEVRRADARHQRLNGFRHSGGGDGFCSMIIR